MSKKTVTICASNSKNSINKAFALYTAKLLQDVEVIRLDHNGFELPLYSPDLETNFTLPNFQDNFQNGGLNNSELKGQLQEKIQLFQNALK